MNFPSLQQIHCVDKMLITQLFCFRLTTLITACPHREQKCSTTESPSIPPPFLLPILPRPIFPSLHPLHTFATETVVKSLRQHNIRTSNTQTENSHIYCLPYKHFRHRRHHYSLLRTGLKCVAKTRSPSHHTTRDALNILSQSCFRLLRSRRRRDQDSFPLHIGAGLTKLVRTKETIRTFNCQRSSIALEDHIHKYSGKLHRNVLSALFELRQCVAHAKRMPKATI